MVLAGVETALSVLSLLFPRQSRPLVGFLHFHTARGFEDYTKNIMKIVLVYSTFLTYLSMEELSRVKLDLT